MGYYTSAEVHPRSPARLLLSKERKNLWQETMELTVPLPVTRTCPPSTMWRKFRSITSEKKTATPIKILIPPRPTAMSTSKKPTDSYAAMFDQMIADGVISTRGLKADAVKYGELLFDVNSAYFHNHGGYEYAKQFYADAYKAAVEIVGGEQYILSAVMHADERNRAMSEALGEDVYHYHLHVVYIPVVEKQILWSKRLQG